ncbi:MAG: hypothetical protein EGQ14_07280 [Spirochaetia bacterium]|nr:hypothetical protein [Spirochaetia bacterium]
MESHFPKEFAGESLKGYMEYTGSNLWEDYPEAVLIGTETLASLPYAKGVDQRKFGEICQERAPFKSEEGYYLMYSGGHLWEGDYRTYWYVIAAGLCEVGKADQYYMANVTCCPK